MTGKLLKIVFKDGRFVVEGDGSVVKPRAVGNIYIHKTPYRKSESEFDIVQRLRSENRRHTEDANAYNCAALEFTGGADPVVVNVALQFFKLKMRRTRKFEYLRFTTDGTHAVDVDATPVGNVSFGKYLEFGVSDLGRSRENECRDAALKELGLEGIANACRGVALELKDLEYLTKATAVQFYEVRR